MELREPIEDINRRLKDEFGSFTDGRPNFRVVYSDDMFEKRIVEQNERGFDLLEPEVQLRPKYKQWVQNRYILERLVPIVGETDLIEKVAYESCWIFQDRYRNYLPPYFEGCKIVIDSLMKAAGKENTHVKYQDPNTKPEERQQMINNMITELFGNETPVGDALAYGSGVSLTPSSEGKEKVH